MFWGIILEPKKRYTQTVEQSFHVSMAALDIKQSNGQKVQVMVKINDKNYLLCTLNDSTVPQTNLDLNFEQGSEISFMHNGKSNFVHLTGYLITDDEEDLLDNVEEEQEDEEEEEVEEQQVSKKKKKNPKTLLDLIDQYAEEGSEADETLEPEDLLEMEDSDDENEEDSDDEEEEQTNGKEEEEDSDDDDDDEEEEEEEQVPKKRKLQNGNAESPKQTKKEKKQKESPQNASPTKKSLEGGVLVEDLKAGNGAVAKPGKVVEVYYVGRLKSNNKQFDAKQNGTGFKFRLGKQEVIKGWDVGVRGMKVGGKRKITCPPTSAYGQKGSPPVIPPNSTLVFEVELLGVK